MRTCIEKFGIVSCIFALVAAPLGAADLTKGKAVYDKKCAMCHAKDLKGNPAMAKVFKVEPEKLSLVSETALAKSEADQIKVTTDGLRKMPAYKGKLTDAEIQDVVAYTRTPAPAPAAK